MPVQNIQPKDKTETTIVTPPASIVDEKVPPNVKLLADRYGKSTNEVQVELDKKMRDINTEQLKNPPSLNDDETTPQAQVRIQAINELDDEYKRGEGPEESDEVTYDELAQDVATDMGQDPNAMDFNMFAPFEQDSANQMFNDINTINSESPVSESPTEDTLDGLADLAEPEDGEAPTSEPSAEGTTEGTTEETPDSPETPKDDPFVDTEIPDIPAP
jgi:hypothetical protein